MRQEGAVAPAGALGLVVHRGGKLDPFPQAPEWPATLSLREILSHGVPQAGLPDEVNAWRRANARHLTRRLKKVALARVLKLPTFYGALFLEKYDAASGRRLPFGLASVAVVTTVGVNFLVDALQGTVEPEILRFHGFGTGGAAEAVGNTALTTELTTQYATDNTRPTGSLTEGASANIFRTVATLDPDADVAITEHGIFSDVDVGEGTLLDRSLFSVINLDDAGDTLQATYDFTITAGG